MDNESPDRAPSPVARGDPGDRWRLPWGPLAAVAGLALLVVGQLALVELLAAAGVDLDGTRGRYGVLLLQFATFAGLPLVIAGAFGGRPSDLGLRRAGLRPTLLGAVCAGPMLGMVIGYQALVQWVSPGLVQALEEEVQRQTEAFAAPLPLMIVVAVAIAPMAEEILFRGLVYGGMRTVLGRWPAAILSAGLFALSHLMPLSGPGLLALGILLALLYERYRSLAVPVALHACFNLLVLAVQMIGPPA